MKKQASLSVLLLALSTFSLGGVAHAFDVNTREVVRATNGTVVTNTWGQCVRTQWEVGGDVCAPVVAQQVRTTTTVQPRKHVEIAAEQRTVYFEFNKSRLTAESKAKLDSLTRILKSQEDVKEAKIVGYADRIGSQSYNQKLSQARAETVKNYIVSHGYANASVADTRWLGESAPVTECPASLKRPELIRCLQADRRVEVEIEYTQEVANNQ